MFNFSETRIIYSFIPPPIVGFGHLVPSFDIMKNMVDKGYQGEFKLLADKRIYTGLGAGFFPPDPTADELAKRLGHQMMRTRYEEVFIRMNGGKEFLSKAAHLIDQLTHRDLEQFVNYRFQDDELLEPDFFKEDNLFVICGYTEEFIERLITRGALTTWFQRAPASKPNPNVFFWASSGIYGVNPLVFLRQSKDEVNTTIKVPRYLEGGLVRESQSLCRIPDAIKTIFLANPGNWAHAFMGILLAVGFLAHSDTKIVIADALEEQKENLRLIKIALATQLSLCENAAKYAMIQKILQFIENISISEKNFELRKCINPASIVFAEGITTIQDACLQEAYSLQMSRKNVEDVVPGQATLLNEPTQKLIIAIREKAMKLSMILTNFSDEGKSFAYWANVFMHAATLSASIAKALPRIKYAEAEHMFKHVKFIPHSTEEPIISLVIKNVSEALGTLKSVQGPYSWFQAKDKIELSPVEAQEVAQIAPA